jgi:aldehyde dehydrogenase (NAD+)
VSIPVEDPATEEIIGEVPAGGAVDVDRAVQAAKGVFDEWRWASANERAELLHEAATKTVEASEDLVALLAREQGKRGRSRKRSWSGRPTACATTRSWGATGAGGSSPAVSRARSSTSC